MRSTEEQRMIDAKGLCELLKISRSTLRRLRREGRVPPPAVAINRQLVRW